MVAYVVCNKVQAGQNAPSFVLASLKGSTYSETVRFAFSLAAAAPEDVLTSLQHAMFLRDGGQTSRISCSFFLIASSIFCTYWSVSF